MAVSLSRFAVHGAKQTEADRLAKEYAAQQKRASKRGLFSGMLGKVGGKLLGGAITGFLGLTGIGAPIGMALGNLLAKKGAHEMTRSMGADPSKLASKSKYGYGEAEAKTLKEGLEAQMVKDPMLCLIRKNRIGCQTINRRSLGLFNRPNAILHESKWN